MCGADMIKNREEWWSITAKVTMPASLLFIVFLCLLHIGRCNTDDHIPDSIISSDDSHFDSIISSPTIFLESPHLLSSTVIPWGLDRMDQQQLPLDGKYQVIGRGGGWQVYVVDSGIDHRRVPTEQPGWSAVGEPDGRSDEFGHGTMVAAVIRSMAPDVDLIPVKVLNRWGMGSNRLLIDGLRWIKATSRNPNMTLINLSLGGTTNSQELVDVTREMTTMGMRLFAAAGNQGRSTGCDFYPSAYEWVWSVGALMSDDRRWPLSNHGQCVELWAPGDLISANGRVASGTSMAVPFVVGAVAVAGGTDRLQVREGGRVDVEGQ